jgi:hypothetical protein
MDSEGSTNQPRERGMTFSVVLFLGLVLIAYPLSLGPVVAIYYPGSELPKWVDWMYKPIDYAERIPAVRACFEWYLQLWVGNRG